MSQFKEVAVGGTVYFWFAANTTTGSAGDGATPLYDVRLAGAASTAAPTASGTPTLLTHANYVDGLHEIAVDSTGYTVGSEYAVFCTLTISTVNPSGFVGSFVVRAAASTLYQLVAAILEDTSVIGAPAGGSLAADLVAIDNFVDGIESTLGVAGAGLTALGDTRLANLDAAVTSRMATFTQPTGFLAATFPLSVASPTNITAATGVVLSGVTHTGAVIPTVTTLTGHTAQTGDVYALANGVNGFVAIKADTAAILIDTVEIGTAGAGLTALATQASVNDLPTNTELATALGTADDAVLTQVALVKAKTDLIPAAPAAVGDAMTLTSTYDFAKGTVAMAESYPVLGATITPAQALYNINQQLGEHGTVGTTMTIKKRDRVTAAKTFTFDSTTPTSITEAT